MSLKHFTRDNAPTKPGGDLWNDSHVCRKVFADPNVVSFWIENRLTGLWCTVRATLADERTITMHVCNGRRFPEIVA